MDPGIIVQCSAINTTNARRCRRNTSNPFMCWQHKRSADQNTLQGFILTNPEGHEEAYEPREARFIRMVMHYLNIMGPDQLFQDLHVNA